nr:MAG TPA: hypothetical protein [Bacteriophage sp.]
MLFCGNFGFIVRAGCPSHSARDVLPGRCGCL